MRLTKRATSGARADGALDERCRTAAVRQAKALLMAADGVAERGDPRRAGVSTNTVRAWRRRFADEGWTGWGVIAKGRGRSRGCRRARWPRWCG